jgi:hypothetical protein
MRCDAYRDGIRAAPGIDQLFSVHKRGGRFLNLPMQTGHAMLKSQNKGSGGLGGRAYPAAKAWPKAGLG